MNPNQYDAYTRMLAQTALDLMAEQPGIMDDRLSSELHEWVSSPESILMSWQNDVEDIIRAREVLTSSQHTNRPLLLPFANDNLGAYSGDSPPDAAMVARLQYIAAHVIVRDAYGRAGLVYTMPADILLSGEAAPR